LALHIVEHAKVSLSLLLLVVHLYMRDACQSLGLRPLFVATGQTKPSPPLVCVRVNIPKTRTGANSPKKKKIHVNCVLLQVVALLQDGL